GVVYRTMDAVFEFHRCGEVNVKSATDALADTPEMQAKRGDTFTLPKGFDGGYGAAVTAIQYIQNLAKMQAKEEEAATAAGKGKGAQGGEAEAEAAADRATSPLFYRAHKTELLLAIQPFAAMPIEDQRFLGLCVVLRDAGQGVTLRTFSQMLPLSCWAAPRDQIVAVDVDASLGSAVNTHSDSAVQRTQEMNEECLYEAVMLAVKSLANDAYTVPDLNSSAPGAAPSDLAAGEADPEPSIRPSIEDAGNAAAAAERMQARLDAIPAALDGKESVEFQIDMHVTDLFDVLASRALDEKGAGGRGYQLVRQVRDATTNMLRRSPSSTTVASSLAGGEDAQQQARASGESRDSGGPPVGGPGAAAAGISLTEVLDSLQYVVDYRLK
ncbi:hypothetical protein IWQ56_005224, partial [Coemansia nantahalensis]